MGDRKAFERIAKIETLANGIINALLNGGLAWLTLGDGGHLTLGGENSYAADTAATAFVLPVLLSLIVISLNRRKLKNGAHQPIDLNPENALETLLARFPTSTWRQALMIGLIATALTTPLVVGLLWASGMQQIAPADYAVIKGLWTGLLAAALTRPALLLALGRPLEVQADHAGAKQS